MADGCYEAIWTTMARDLDFTKKYHNVKNQQIIDLFSKLCMEYFVWRDDDDVHRA